MPAGSVVVFAGTLGHRGGANHTDGNRLGITPQYCEPRARQFENMILVTSRHAIDYSDSIRSMLGYSITPPSMGYVDGRHPMKVLDPDFDPASTGDGARSQVFWDDECRFRSATDRDSCLGPLPGGTALSAKGRPGVSACA
jgi:ectoine hydroxylase-related dioxygenase (phytanoyl-CoA dioxygenase family)